MTGPRWQDDAVCFHETPDAPELWTANHKPHQTVRTHLQQMCRRCPVEQTCAAAAINDETTEAGIYAGVWVPLRASRKHWDAAMKKLTHIAVTTPDVAHDDPRRRRAPYPAGADPTAPAAAPRPSRRHPDGYDAVADTVRRHLAALPEPPDVRTRHVAALLAFTPNTMRPGNRIRFTFDHGPTALWASQMLGGEGVTLIEASASHGVIDVHRPQTRLSGYGFRGGQWVFGHGKNATLGISRGAVHASCTLNRHGLKVTCPTVPMMLTLTAVMARLGITATPTGQTPRTAIRNVDVCKALSLLGIPHEIAATYLRPRDGNSRNDAHTSTVKDLGRPDA